MIRVILVLIISISAQAFSKKSQPIPVETPPSPSPIVTSITNQSQLTTNNIQLKCVTCTDKERIKIKNAENTLNQQLNSKCFEDYFLKEEIICYQGGAQRCPKGKRTPKDIFAHLRAAKITVPVHYYFEKSTTIGYRQPPEIDIYFNRKFHDSYNNCQTASNALHEATHGLDYDHSMNYDEDRDYTVSYQMNWAIEGDGESHKGCCK